MISCAFHSIELSIIQTLERRPGLFLVYPGINEFFKGRERNQGAISILDEKRKDQEFFSVSIY